MTPGAYATDKIGADASGVVLRIPRASMWNVLEVAAEYDFPSLPTMLQPRVLDIGANCGIFAIACCQLLQGARVMSFEPHPETCALLRHNVAGLPVEVHEKAVVGYERPLMLHEGKRNRLCCSLQDVGDQDMDRGFSVGGHMASELPPCDLMKIDTEGCEVEILEAYRHLGGVKVLMLELHGATPQALLEEGRRVATIAHKAGLSQIDQRANTLRFARHG